MRAYKVFTTAGDHGTGQDQATTGILVQGTQANNFKSTWVDFQNTRDDKVMLLLHWSNRSAGAGLSIRVHGLMESSSNDRHSETLGASATGSVTMVPIILPTAVTGAGDEVGVVTHTELASTDLDGPYTYNIEAVGADDSYLTAYLPKLPRMYIQVYQLTTANAHIDAWLIG